MFWLSKEEAYGKRKKATKYETAISFRQGKELNKTLPNNWIIIYIFALQNQVRIPRDKKVQKAGLDL